MFTIAAVITELKPNIIVKRIPGGIRRDKESNKVSKAFVHKPCKIGGGPSLW